MQLLADHLWIKGDLKVEEAYVDATFAGAKKGAWRSVRTARVGCGPTRRGKGTKILAIAADNSALLAISVQSASLHESRLVEEVLAGSFLDELLARLIGDRAYDSDALDQRSK